MKEQSVVLKFASNPPVIECKCCRDTHTLPQHISYEDIEKEISAFKYIHGKCERQLTTKEFEKLWEDNPGLIDELPYTSEGCRAAKRILNGDYSSRLSGWEIIQKANQKLKDNG